MARLAEVPKPKIGATESHLPSVCMHCESETTITFYFLTAQQLGRREVKQMYASLLNNMESACKGFRSDWHTTCAWSFTVSHIPHLTLLMDERRSFQATM
jgi:hypothetical protein